MESAFQDLEKTPAEYASSSLFRPAGKLQKTAKQGTDRGVSVAVAVAVDRGLLVGGLLGACLVVRGLLAAGLAGGVGLNGWIGQAHALEPNEILFHLGLHAVRIVAVGNHCVAPGQRLVFHPAPLGGRFLGRIDVGRLDPTPGDHNVFGGLVELAGQLRLADHGGLDTVQPDACQPSLAGPHESPVGLVVEAGRGVVVLAGVEIDNHGRHVHAAAQLRLFLRPPRLLIARRLRGRHLRGFVAGRPKNHLAADHGHRALHGHHRALGILRAAIERRSWPASRPRRASPCPSRGFGPSCPGRRPARARRGPDLLRRGDSRGQSLRT